MKLKKFLSRISILFLLACFCNTSCVEQPKDDLLLFDFEDGFDQTSVMADDASFELQKVADNHVLKVKSGFNSEGPGITLFEPKENPWNLHGFSQVEADITNTGDEFLQVQLTLGNQPDYITQWLCSNFIDLNPGDTKTLTVKLSWTPWILEPQLDIVGMYGIPGKFKTDLNAIDQLRFTSRYAKSDKEFTIDNVRASGELEIWDTAGFFPFVDEFGQFIHKDWIGKMHSLQELEESAEIEQRDLLENPEPEDRNKYGGWTAGPQLEKTGFFRTEKYNGKWWMVDPEGRLFWSAGMNCVAPGGMVTGIKDREHYFKFLPAEDSDLGQFYRRNRRSRGVDSNRTFTSYNFYTSNLYRKYGDQLLEEYRALAHQRFRSWGMNTLGFVSDTEAMKQQKTPYVGSVWIRGTVPVEGSEAFWRKFHDIFDPGFRLAVRNSMERQKTGAGDPWCIGFYVDNELGWGKLGSFALHVLASPGTQPAKKEFLKDLKQKYQTIEALNNTWGTTHASWAEFLECTETPDPDKAMVDLAVFYEKMVDTYFKTIKEELNRIAPGQSYLGCRFAWSNNDVTLRTASKYMDIMSFNKYETGVEDLSLPEGVDKPIIIGEWHVGAIDRGNFHPGLKEVNNQAERGEFYQNYIHSALRNPLIVGAHWFQYTDESITGRFDGENFNIGFVDICDNPYNEMINKARETHYSMYEYRLNK